MTRARFDAARTGHRSYIDVVAIEAVIEQALKLSVEDRTELVARLLDSIELVDAAEAMTQARAAAARRR